MWKLERPTEGKKYEKQPSGEGKPSICALLVSLFIPKVEIKAKHVKWGTTFWQVLK